VTDRKEDSLIKVQIGDFIYPLANDEWIINQRLLLPDIAFLAIKLLDCPKPEKGWLLSKSF
jgi:hypothetical protein